MCTSILHIIVYIHIQKCKRGRGKEKGARMCGYIHTYVHTYIHFFVDPYVHFYMHARTHARTCWASESRNSACRECPTYIQRMLYDIQYKFYPQTDKDIDIEILHTYMHAYVHRHIYAHIHRYVRSCMHAYIRTHGHACMHTYLHNKYMHASIHTYARACMQAYIRTHGHASYIHTCLCTCMHTTYTTCVT